MSKRTKGPWKAEFVKPRGDGFGHFEIVAEMGRVVVDTLNCDWTIERHSHGMDTEEEANARLIAAAPTMKEAMEDVIEALELVVGTRVRFEMEEAVRGAIVGSVNVLRAAVAKVEGE